MAIVQTRDLTIGMMVSEDVYSKAGQLIVRKDSLLTRQMISHLKYYFITEVDIYEAELAEDIRHTPEYADLYKLRKEKIERVFADAKEKHAMRYTPYTGLAQVTNWVRLKFATMNLKKLAKWKWKRNNTPSKLFDFIVFLIKTKKNPIFA